MNVERFKQSPQEALDFDPLQRGLTEILGGYLDMLAETTSHHTPEAVIEKMIKHLDALSRAPKTSYRTTELAKVMRERLADKSPISTDIPLLGEQGMITYERFTVDAGECAIYSPHVNGGETPIPLTSLQGKLALMFVTNGGRIIPSSRLIEFAWGTGQADANTLKTHINGLRKRTLDHGEHFRNRPQLGYALIDNNNC